MNSAPHVAALDEGGGNAAGEVRALAVVHHGVACLAQHIGDHIAGGCFAIGAGNCDDFAIKGKAAQQGRVQFHGQFAHNIGAPAGKFGKEGKELAHP